MPKPLVAAVAVCLAWGGVACGSDSPEGGSPAAPGTQSSALPGDFDAEDVSFGALLAQIRGHHAVSLALYEAGDVEGAAVHAGHPIAEILASIQSELRASAGPADPLEAALRDGAQAIADGVPPAELASIYERAGTLTEEAAEASLGEVAGSASYGGSVIASLLGTVADEYGEAVGRKGIRLLVEYQDAFAFTGEARRLYGDVAAAVERAASEEAAEIDGAFADLAEVLASPAAPDTPAPVQDVDAATALIGQELEETVGARVETNAEPGEVAAEIERLLDVILEEYEAGNADAAAELSAEAYLENYEVIEAAVIDLAPEINSELEPLLGAALRRAILDGEPAAEIETMIDQARILLGRAVRALEHAGGH